MLLGSTAQVGAERGGDPVAHAAPQLMRLRPALFRQLAGLISVSSWSRVTPATSTSTGPCTAFTGPNAALTGSWEREVTVTLSPSRQSAGRCQPGTAVPACRPHRTPTSTSPLEPAATVGLPTRADGIASGSGGVVAGPALRLPQRAREAGTGEIDSRAPARRPRAERIRESAHRLVRRAPADPVLR